MSLRPRILIAGALVGLVALTGTAVAATTGPVSGKPAAAPTNAANGRVEAIVGDGINVYVGGSFTQAGGETHSGLAAFSGSAGTIVSGFSVNVTGEVMALALSGGYLYAGGNFTYGTQKNLIRISLPSFVEDTSWSPNPNNYVHALAVSSTDVYAGGNFTKIGSPAVSLPRLAAVQISAPGAVDSSFTPPTPNTPSGGASHVDALSLMGSTLYVGGFFQQLGATKQKYLASVNATSGALNTNWLPGGLTCPVDGQALTSTDLYIACAGGKTTGNQADDVDVATGTIRWKACTDGNLNAVVPLSGVVYVGGHFGHFFPSCTSTGTATATRHHAADLDATNGALNADWLPRFNSALGVYGMYADTSNHYLWVGGDFTSVNGNTSYPHLVRFAF